MSKSGQLGTVDPPSPLPPSDPEIADLAKVVSKFSGLKPYVDNRFAFAARWSELNELH